MKLQIRRIYDVTNVLCSLNLISKQTITRKAALEAETFDNVDSPILLKSTTTTAAGAEGDNHLGKKASLGASKNHRGHNERADAKVLEWTSFLPAVIREHYLVYYHGKAN
jgi:hypothetical protein